VRSGRCERRWRVAIEDPVEPVELSAAQCESTARHVLRCWAILAGYAAACEGLTAAILQRRRA
jgi:hypothetical protein